MANSTVSWDDATQGSTISGLEQQVLEMQSAKNKILPEIDVLRPRWNTEGSIKTIDTLEQFLNTDFEEFVKLFYSTIVKLKDVRRLSQIMNNLN